MNPCRTLTLLGIFFLLAGWACATEQASFEVDCSVWDGVPLVKTKFGVYQTPLRKKEEILQSLDLLKEINVRDFRYEMGWGKDDTLCKNQIGGTAEAPTIDFAMLADDLIGGLAKRGVRPLIATGYCPDPLKVKLNWPGWKDPPRDMNGWRTVHRAFAGHFRTSLGAAEPYWEIWNEPDMPEGNGKMFFSGNADQYRQVYLNGAAGVKEAAADAVVGGPAIAFDQAYTTAMLNSGQPFDFVSIHAYRNWAEHIAAMRGMVKDRPQVPVFLTEYASYDGTPGNYGMDGRISRHAAAAMFFRDVCGMLNCTDAPKVYWAQWVDDWIGMLTNDLRRKALFNAFKLYGMMPVDRCRVQPESAAGVGAMASADAHQACVAIWNERAEERVVSVSLKKLPFADGQMDVYRISRNHSSVLDNKDSEKLEVLETKKLGAAETNWMATLPGESVAFLRVHNDQSQEKTPVPPKAQEKPGAPAKNLYWFFDRASRNYSDFDAQTWTARLGAPDKDFAVALIGAVVDDVAKRLRVQVTRQGPFRSMDRNSIFALRVDYAGKDGGYAKSVLVHGGLFDAARDSVLPWGKGGATADEVIKKDEFDTGQPFVLDVERLAPPDWNGRRVILSFWLQNPGAGSRARLELTRE
jgi:hypothetical protein